MKKRYIPLIAIVVLIPSLFAALTPLISTNEVEWLSYQDARQLDSDKPIFVFAKMRFCVTCAAMEKQTFTDPGVAKVLNTNFIPVEETINFALSNFIFDDLFDDMGETLKFRGFPAVMIIKGDNYAISHGYKSAEELQIILAKALSN
jgi:thioredoxin-related protein